MGAPWFKLYANDLLSDSKVRLLTDAQLGKLLKLWAFCCKDGSIPTDLAIASRLLGNCSSNDLAPLVEFFSVSDANPAEMVSHRMMREQATYQEKAKKLRDNGALGGKKKQFNRLANATANALANSTESESESERKELPPTPSATRKGRKAKGKVDPFAEYPEPLIDAVNVIGDLTPSADPDGRAIRIDAAKLIERMDGMTKSNPAITPGLLAESWRDYLASKPMKIKAPQYFFGDAKDNGDGANWHPFARLIWHRQRKASERVEPLLVGVSA